MRRLLVLAVVTLAALVAASVAGAHTVALTAVATCQEETGTYRVDWTLTTANGAGPKVIESDNPAIPVGSSPGVFTQEVGGTTTSVSAHVRIRWSDNYKAKASLTLPLAGTCRTPTPPPPPTCPAGLTFVSYDGKTLVCKETTTVTVDRPVPGPERVVEKIVFGTCAAPAVTVATSTGPICVVTKTVKVKVPVPGPTKWKWKTKRVIVIRYVPCTAAQVFDTKTRTCKPRSLTG